jgi:iron-sulfur cluster assembly protein
MQPITFTKAAIEHLMQMLKKENGKGFRLSIKKTGCSGYAYVPAIITEVKNEDLHFFAGELPVYVDSLALSFVSGLRIDYVEDKNIGLKQKRLLFMNPNEKNRCGCGESFTIE